MVAAPSTARVVAVSIPLMPPRLPWALVVVITFNGQPSDPSVYAEFVTEHACWLAVERLNVTSRTSRFSVCLPTDPAGKQR